MPQHQHRPLAKCHQDRNPKYHEEQQKDVDKITYDGTTANAARYFFPFIIIGTEAITVNKYRYFSMI